MSASSNDPVDKVRELQRTLWRAAKQHRGRRFHALYDRTLKFTQMDHYVRQRLGLLLARRRGFPHKHRAISQWSFDWFWGLGLHRLAGTVRYPGAAHA